MTMTIDSLPADWLSLVADTERRNGTVELCPDPDHYDTHFCQVNIHKVRLLYLQDRRWIIERPFSLKGQPAITRDMHLLGILGSGAHRWSFRTTVEAVVRFKLNDTQTVAALRLSAPTDVQSAQRRAFFRVHLLAANIPDVTCWPLLDLSSAIESEKADEHLHREGELPSPRPLPPTTDQPFTAPLNDLSGNGVSILVDDEHLKKLEQNPLLWLKLDLPDLSHPLMVVARYVRQQPDAVGRRVVGLTFQFRHNRSHESFINDQICRWAAAEQRRQLHRPR